MLHRNGNSKFTTGSTVLMPLIAPSLKHKAKLISSHHAPETPDSDTMIPDDTIKIIL